MKIGGKKLKLFEEKRELVRKMGFEPTHPKALAPQASVSTIPPPAHKKKMSAEADREVKKAYATKYGLA